MRRLELLGAQLRVRGRRGVDDERLGVSHVGEMREKPDVVYNLKSCLAPTCNAKDQHTPKPVPEKAARKIMTRVIRKARVAHPLDLGMVLQELCHGKRVRAVALNA